MAKTKRAVCRVGGPLSEARRKRLTPTEFGLPAERKYPIPDVSHARNAKARAAQQLNRGNLTRAQYRQITQRADRVIARCSNPGHNPGNPGHANPGGRMPPKKNNPDNPMSPGMKTALWVGGAVVGVAAVGGIVYAATRKKEGEENGKAAGEAPDMPGPGGLPPPPIPIPTPYPPVPAMPEPEGLGGAMADEEEPAAGATGGTIDIPAGALGMSNHGVTVDLTKRTITVLNPDTWVAWAGPEVAAINVEEWPAADIVDNVYAKAFPILPGKLSTLAGWTINGQPVADILQRAQTFLDGIVAGELTVPKNFPGHRAFAKIAAGQEYTPLKVTVTPPEVNPDVNMELWQREKPGYGLHHYIVRATKSDNPALGQTIFSWTWWVWAPGVVVLDENNAMTTGGKSQKKDAIKAARDYIDQYAIAVAIPAQTGS